MSQWNELYKTIGNVPCNKFLDSIGAVIIALLVCIMPTKD